MDFHQFKILVKDISTGKQLPDSVYIHESAITSVPPQLAKVILKIADALKIPDDEWNILKFYKRDYKVAFLSYPAFEIESYPPLKHSYTVDLAKLSMRNGLPRLY